MLSFITSYHVNWIHTALRFSFRARPVFLTQLVHLLACTFLGPSRKRGPPKGYIDAIEARLHQTEALLGIIIGVRDERAQSLLRDIARVSSVS